MNEDEDDDDITAHGNTAMGRMEERQRGIRNGIQRLEDKLDAYLTRTEFMAHFWPVRALVYGMAALLLSSVVAALIALIIVKPMP